MKLQFYFGVKSFLIGYSFDQVESYGWWFTVNLGFLAIQIFRPENKTV